jgi:hypothetical protein
MKRQTQKLNAAKIAQEYPIADLVEGWYFKLEEVSSGAYRAEGTDLWGRRVSYSSTDPDEALAKCTKYALSII